MAAAATAAFVVVALVVVLVDPVPGDRATVDAVHDVVGTRADTPMRWVGTTGTAWVLAPVAVLLAGWCVVRRAWRTLALVAGTAAVVWLVNPGLKRVFARDRPDVRAFVEPTSRWTFPGGHAVASAAFATLLVVLTWPTRARRPVVAGVGAYVVAVAISRLVLGVHYPSDLLAGWALGVAAVTGLAATLLDRGRRPGADPGRTAGSRPPGPRPR